MQGSVLAAIGLSTIVLCASGGHLRADASIHGHATLSCTVGLNGRCPALSGIYCWLWSNVFSLLRAGDTRFAFRLNAVHSIRRGAYLTFTFRSAAG
jgi:hypothetical protein